MKAHTVLYNRHLGARSEFYFHWLFLKFLHLHFIFVINVTKDSWFFYSGLLQLPSLMLMPARASQMRARSQSGLRRLRLLQSVCQTAERRLQQDRAV